ncbi:hypothetical protein AKJ45_01340 [candidate division MSBL1 archaeon SCGC-AAA261F19]|uniref:Uncharacterized protein n=1 Tax=candidate division MSBL1 archaeon SCGC-AAA261F19 TaxID=1698275 RepID=A0A133VAV2_9EURY|nr:hypothetical protein AKJ45_01340 [candidate division MSBL1 archaeon SCGC-AAA261F19]
MTVRISAVETLLVILVASAISVSIGVVLFGVIGIASGIGWQLIAAALLLMVSISVVGTLVFYFTFRSYTSERATRVAMMTLTGDEWKDPTGRSLEEAPKFFKVEAQCSPHQSRTETRSNPNSLRADKYFGTYRRVPKKLTTFEVRLGSTRGVQQAKYVMIVTERFQ